MTLDDFKQMLEKIAKPGLMGKMMSLMPGMGQLREMLDSEEAAGGVRQTIGAINSMTKAERRNPKIIDVNRRMRIAKGSGVQPTLVAQVVKQFETMKPIMQALSSGSIGDRMQMMRTLQSSGALADPNLRGLNTKKGTGKRLTSEEKLKLRKQREKELRKKKRRG